LAQLRLGSGGDQGYVFDCVSLHAPGYYDTDTLAFIRQQSGLPLEQMSERAEQGRCNWPGQQLMLGGKAVALYATICHHWAYTLIRQLQHFGGCRDLAWAIQCSRALWRAVSEGPARPTPGFAWEALRGIMAA
jgi:hypothetical protein